jgi:hypothetical protein
MRILTTFLALAAFAVPIAPRAFAATAGNDTPKATLPYEQIAKEFAKDNGLDASKPEGLTYDDMLSKAFVRLDVGAFDVRFPRADLDKRGENLRASVQAVLGAQEKWLDWLAPAGGDQKSLRDDLKVLESWVKAWKMPALAKAKEVPEADLAKNLAAPDNVVAASKRLFDALCRGAAFGAPRDTAEPVRLVFTPTRKEFAGFVYFFGWINSDQRGLFWLDSVPDWTQCFVINDQVIALEYAGAGRKPDDYTTGSPMGEILAQQVAQLSMNSLLAAHYAEKVPGPFLGGLSMNLVIDEYGEVRTRIDGDTRSKVTNARSVFVAGGQSEGGQLGKNSAETKWREGGGKDHFLGTLHAAQVEGGKLAKDPKEKFTTFSIRSDSGGDKWAAVAPFLGADAKAPAADFVGDYAEFFRAYKSAFIFWLQTKSQATEKASREKFAALLQKLADPKLTTDFESAFKDVYGGATLTGPGADKETLEGKFLVWLTRQK